MEKGSRIFLIVGIFVFAAVIVPILFIGSFIFNQNGGFACMGIKSIKNPLFSTVSKDLRDRIYEKSFFGEKNGTFYTITQTHGELFDEKKCIVIKSVDNASFQVLNQFYAKDKNQGYFDDGTHMVHLFGPALSFNIDSNSFEVLGGKSHYAKDANNVYFNGQIINDADPITFSLTDSDASLDCVEGGKGKICTQKYDAEDAFKKYDKGKWVNSDISELD